MNDTDSGGPEDPSDKAIIKAAQRLHHEDGTLEIDDLNDPLPRSRVSRGDEPGAYVLAWVWIPYEDVLQEDEE